MFMDLQDVEKHTYQIFLKKINSYLINAENFNFQNIISNIENKKIECLIIDNHR